jgi:hypothetical protein
VAGGDSGELGWVGHPARRDLGDEALEAGRVLVTSQRVGESPTR